MSEKSATVTLRYSLDNSQALDALRAIETEHDRIARRIGQPISIGGVSGGGSSIGSGGSPYIPSWANPSLARFAVGGSPGGGSDLAQRMNQGGGSFGGQSPNFQNSLFRQMLTHLQKISSGGFGGGGGAGGAGGAGGGGGAGGAGGAGANSNLIVHALGRVNATIERGNGLLVQINTRMARISPDGGFGRGSRDRHGDGAGDGVHPSGMGNAVTRQMTRMAVAYLMYQIVSEIPHATSQTVNTARNSDLTDGQRSRRVMEELPVVGRLITSAMRLADAIDGTTEQIRRSGIMLASSRIALRNATEYASAAYQGNIQVASAQGRAGALNRLNPRLVGANDRTTFGGQVAYDEAEARREGQIRLDMAEADRAGASAGLSQARMNEQDAGDALAQARANYEQIKAQANAAQNPQPAMGVAPPTNIVDSVLAGLPGFMGGFPGVSGAIPAGAAGGLSSIIGGVVSGGAMLASGTGQAGLNAVGAGLQSQAPTVVTGNQQLAAGEALVAAERQLQQAMRDTQRMVEQNAQAESRAAQARIQNIQTEINLRQQQEQRMSRGAQSLGMMNPMDRQINMNAFRMVQERGIENVPHFIREQANRVAPNTIGRMAEQSGANSEDFRTLQRAGEHGGNANDTLAGVRDAIDGLKNELTRADLTREQATANSILMEVGRTLHQILMSINRIGGIEQENQFIGNVVAQAGQG